MIGVFSFSECAHCLLSTKCFDVHSLGSKFGPQVPIENSTLRQWWPFPREVYMDSAGKARAGYKVSRQNLTCVPTIETSCSKKEWPYWEVLSQIHHLWS